MKKIFISGTAGFGTKTLSELPQPVKELIDKIIAHNDMILVGDCQGIDTLVQTYVHAAGYKNVTVYFSGNRCRNMICSDWNKKSVPVPYGTTGRAFFAVKDKAMADDADSGLAIWDGKSVGTGNNISNLRAAGKGGVIYRIDTQTMERI